MAIYQRGNESHSPCPETIPIKSEIAGREQPHSNCRRQFLYTFGSRTALSLESREGESTEESVGTSRACARVSKRAKHGEKPHSTSPKSPEEATTPLLAYDQTATTRTSQVPFSSGGLQDPEKYGFPHTAGAELTDPSPRAGRAEQGWVQEERGSAAQPAREESGPGEQTMSRRPAKWLRSQVAASGSRAAPPPGRGAGRRRATARVSGLSAHLPQARQARQARSPPRRDASVRAPPAAEPPRASARLERERGREGRQGGKRSRAAAQPRLPLGRAAAKPREPGKGGQEPSAMATARAGGEAEQPPPLRVATTLEEAPAGGGGGARSRAQSLPSRQGRGAARGPPVLVVQYVALFGETTSLPTNSVVHRLQSGSIYLKTLTEGG
jgi:hypothetical protein